MRCSDGTGTDLLLGPLASHGERSPRPRSQRLGPAGEPAPARLIVVLGPTGTGKSEVALEIARRLDGEIIGCDALQVYRGLDVATAKPDPDARREIPHHLIDEVDPRRDFSLAEFVALAERAIEEIAARRRVPIVAGGTGLYLRGLLRGIVALPPRDQRLRERLRRVADRRGVRFLHRWLTRVDPASATRLAPGDRQRILRALELGLAGPRTWSERLREDGTFADASERYAAVKLGLALDRETLARRLDERVERFFRAGLVDEVRALLAAGLPAGANALKAIGYREVARALEAGVDPLGVLDEVQRNTRRYAKRQLTWFRREPGVVWFDARDRGRIVEHAVALWRDGTAP